MLDFFLKDFSIYSCQTYANFPSSLHLVMAYTSWYLILVNYLNGFSTINCQIDVSFPSLLHLVMHILCIFNPRILL